MAEVITEKKQKIKLKLKSYDHRILDNSLKNIVEVVKKTGAKISGPILLPTKISKYTVQRSVHADKKSREQFELKVYKRLMEIIDPTPATMMALEKLTLPAGIDVIIKS